MYTGTIHPSTGTNVSRHGGPGDPQENIAALRQAARDGGFSDAERDQFEAWLAERDAVIGRQAALLAELGHRLTETERARDEADAESVALRNALHRQHEVADDCRRAADAYRGQAGDLAAENRVLRGRLAAAETQLAGQGATLVLPRYPQPGRWPR